MLERGWVFVRQAGTIILLISIVLWFLAYFPRSEEIDKEAQARIEKCLGLVRGHTARRHDPADQLWHAEPLGQG